MIINILNNKGGVGKTTITQNLGIYLASTGLKIGLIDFDSQANLSYSIKHTPNLDVRTLILKKQPISINEFSETIYPNLYLLPNNKDIDTTLFTSFNDTDRLFILKDILQKNTGFDLILIDNAPSVDTQSIVTLIASDYVLVPVEFEVFSAIGLSVLYDAINSVKRLNPDLKMLGILPSKVDERFKITNEVRKSLQRNISEDVLNSAIRTNVKFKSAQMQQQSIFEFEKNESEKKGITDIIAVAEEILSKIK